MSPVRYQAIIWTSADILSIRPQGTYFNELLNPKFSGKCIWKYRLENGGHFVLALMVSSVTTLISPIRVFAANAYLRHTAFLFKIRWCLCLSRLISHWTNEFLNTLRARLNGRHFPDDIFEWIFLNENVWISINISLKFVPRGPINNIPTLVQVMAWRRPGDKPLSGPMMVSLPTHICVTRPHFDTGLLTVHVR